jgi:thiol:disulfide interchange protein DsbD
MPHRRTRIAFVVGLVILLAPAIAFAAGADPGAFEQAKQDGWFAAYLTSFTVGIATSLTPCVYPMIPIVIGIFGARGKDVSRVKAITLATLYVLGMGVTFSTLGVVFALIGQKSGMGTLLADPRFVIPMVGLYAILAASMFGAFELNLPASWQAKLSQVGGQGYGGAFLMGLVGGFTAAPCTGPFLGGLLTWVGTTGDVALGGSLLFVYALGMGVLFFVLAATAASLPKSGRWMEWVKSAGGVALVVAALYFLQPIVPVLADFGQHNFGFLMAAVALAALGLGMGAVHLSFHDAGPVKVRKAIGVITAVAGLFMIVAWWEAVPRELPWIHDDENAAYAKAKAEHKGVMIDFGATWCGACKELEHTFATHGVYEGIVADFVPLKLDVSKGNDRDDELQTRYKAQTLPAVIFLDADHHEIGRIASYVGSDGFHAVLDPAAAEIRKHRGEVSKQ